MTDREIVQLYFDRDERAIAETDKKYGKLCRRIALNILGDGLDAEECQNDVLLAAWNAIPPADPRELRPFVARIARNIAIKKLEYRTAAKRGETPLPFEELEEILGDDELSGNGDGELIAAAISNFLKDLGAEDRRVFVKRYFALDPLEAIALDEGCSESRIKSKLFRIRKKLREHLYKEGITL